MPTSAAERLEQPATPLTRKDFQTDQEVRWCPGCGDYAILAQFQKTLAGLPIPREKHVVVGGIGCASRFPYYVDTYGIHGIHGRAPAIATGIKLARPDLTVWVATGDGDALSIGGNHLMHALRRNVDIKILLFNNRIYGLTKGQYSPTSRPGSVSRSSPLGSVDNAVEPARVALGAGATFVARSIATDTRHLQQVLARAAAHRGTAFVEIYQNCPIFNDEAFGRFTDAQSGPARSLRLAQGEPLVFGPDRDRGIALGPDLRPRVVAADDPGVLVHDEASDLLHALLAGLGDESLPTPFGVIRAVEQPTYDGLVEGQIRAARAGGGASLQALLEAGAAWTVG